MFKKKLSGSRAGKKASGIPPNVKKSSTPPRQGGPQNRFPKASGFPISGGMKGLGGPPC